MKVYTHNFNPNSNSGPNKFTRQLFNSLINRKKIEIVKSQDSCDLEFALIQFKKNKKKPTLLRLDGIYFNTLQDYDLQNQPIEYAYRNSDHVVFQSNFNKILTEKWFGPKQNSSVIHNSPDVDFISKVNTNGWDKILDKNIEVWSCASSWRPHKRLEDNIKFFIENSPKKSVFLIAGDNADINLINKYNRLSNNRIKYLGNLNYYSLISLYKRSTKFLHLAYLDHCPNVVVDAQACNCEIVCSSTGGTHEIVSNGLVLVEKEWDFSPINLYNPPKLDFKKIKSIKSKKLEKNISNTADLYFKQFLNII